MKMNADRPATQHHVPATSYSHPPSNELPSSALRASLPNVQPWLDENAPARTVHNTTEGTHQNNNYVVATTSAALPPNLVATQQAIWRQIDLATRHLVQSCPQNSGQEDQPVSSTPRAAQSNMDVATTTSPPSSHPPNPYAEWDPRHAKWHATFATFQQLSATSYLITVQTDAEKKEAAASKLTRWLARIIFKRNLQRRLNRRKHVKRRSHIAALLINSVLISAIEDNKSSTTAPTPLFTSSPRKQHYPTPAEIHPFRHRGMTLPPLSSKRKRGCRRRCFRRSHQARTRGTPRSKSSAQNHPLPTKVIHPTRACPHCPAFFHQQSDLDDHVILCKPVASVASSESTHAADAVLSCDDASSQPVQVASTLPSHVPYADAALSTAEATSFPSSHPIHPTTTPEGGAVKTTHREPSTTTIDWSIITANTINNILHQYPYLFLMNDTLQPYPNLSTHEDLQLMNHILTTLRQLLPSDLAILYKCVTHWIEGPPPD